jgi:hypothetical protein
MNIVEIHVSLSNFVEYISTTKITWENLLKNLFRSGSGTGRFEKLDPDLDTQHWL